jgi:transglutaminase-like putative cysteine protease
MSRGVRSILGRRPVGDLVAVAAGVALVSLCAVRFGVVFGDVYRPWGAVVAPAVHGVLALVIPPWRWWWRAMVQAATVVVLASAAVAGAGGALADVAGAVISGAGTILSGRWPTAPSPDAVGLVTALAAVAGAASAELAWHRRPPATLLAAPLGLLTAGALLAAPAGMPSVGFLLLFVGAATLTLAASAAARASADRRLVRLERTGSGRRAGRVLVPVLAVVVATAAGLAAVGGSAARFDPRDARSDPLAPLAEISPLSRVDEWRSRTPAQVLFRAEGAEVTRWRLVALTRYDGRAWMPPGELRRAGSILEGAPAGAEQIRATVVVDALDGRWVPVPAGEPVSVGRALRTDATHSGLLADEVLASGDRIAVTVARAAADADALAATTAVRRSDTGPVDGFEIPASVRSLATTIVDGAANDVERAVRLAAYLKEQYRRVDDSPAGHSSAMVQLFLERTKRGRDEQFVAAYGLLAQAVGLPVRIAVGFAGDPATGDVRSDRALAWPEVEFAGVGWVAFDPVPATEAPPAAGGAGSAGVVGQEQLPAPPTTAPVPPTTVPPDELDGPVTAPGRGIPAAVVVPVVSVVGVLALVGAYLGLVGLLKRRRRARLLDVGDERARVVGAFVVGIDWLTDLGAPTRAEATDRELVVVAAVAVGDGAAELEPLARLATASVYSDGDPPAEVVDAAKESLERFEGFLASLGRRRWLRARFSLRSLRRPFPR